MPEPMDSPIVQALRALTGRTLFPQAPPPSQPVNAPFAPPASSWAEVQADPLKALANLVMGAVDPWGQPKGMNTGSIGGLLGAALPLASLARGAEAGVAARGTQAARGAEEAAPGIRAYHGSPVRNLDAISANPAARQYDNATSQFGAFGAPHPAGATRYAGSDGVVYTVDMPIKRPYEMSWREFDYFQSPHKAANGTSASDWTARAEELKREAIALRDRLMQEGYDGIVVRGGRNNDVKEIASFADAAVRGVWTPK